MTFSLNGTYVLLSLLVLVVCVALVIILMRSYLKWKTHLHLDPEKKNDIEEFIPESRNKYSDVNPFKLSTPVFLFGLAISLISTLVAFSWTKYDDPIHYQLISSKYEELEITPPIYIPRKPLPPPPPPKELIVEDTPEDIPSPEFLDRSITADDFIETPLVTDEVIKEIKKPAVAPKIIELEDDPVLIAEQMPRFPGCEDLELPLKEKELCSKQKLLDYIYKSLKYPRLALDNGIEGMVVIQFVVGTSGEIRNIKIARDIGGGCGEAASRVVESMNNLPDRWTPGRQRGQKVKVLYTLPVKFEIGR